MSIPDQIVSYSQFISQRRDLPESPPQWVHEQRLSYPHHPKHSELISAYSQAKEHYDTAVRALQFGINRCLSEPGNPQVDESIKRSQQQVEAAEKALKQAEQTLQEFNNHTPEQRIALYEAEIASLEVELMEAHAVEHEFTENLLNDPNAAKKG